MPDDEMVANPGSTLGEAVGATMEREVNRLLRPLAEESECVFLSAGRPNPRTGAATTLYLNDEFGTRYKVDSVIANACIQPLVLVESKYIRYKKHNRDKGSLDCQYAFGPAPHLSYRSAVPCYPRRKLERTLQSHEYEARTRPCLTWVLSALPIRFQSTV